MIISEMKPMVYGGKTEVLYYEVFDDGFGILIKNIRGSHPCGYIKVPDEIKNKLIESDSRYVEDTIWIDADIHGGITFVGYMDDSEDYFIGWDYAHCGDYCWYGLAVGFPNHEKKWTTEEILEEAKGVLNALRDGKYSIEEES